MRTTEEQLLTLGSEIPIPAAPQSSMLFSEETSTSSNAFTVKDAFFRLVRHPVQSLIHRWNWKSAVLSSLLRASLFFAINLSAGWAAAVAAMKTELVFRAITSGFYGALTEAFREAEPPWAAALAVAFLLPFANHSIELLVHWIRGTRNLFSSILASMILTAFSTLFNFYLMRQGVLIVGSGRSSLGSDLARMPKLILKFVISIPHYVVRILSRDSKTGPLP